MLEPSPTDTSLRSLRFGPFELSLASGELRKNGVRLKLSGQAIQVLLVLAEHPGSIVSREELQQRLWPGNSYGDFEHGLNAAVNRLRETLGDSADEPKYIETIPRRGYRFVGSIESCSSDSKQNGKGIYAFVLKHWKWLALGALGLAVAASLLSLLLHREKQSAAVRVVPLSTLPGEKISPSFSPDGSQVAFGWSGETEGQGFDLYVKVVGTEKSLRLTNRPADWLDTAWSPDGRFIAVARFSKQDPGVYLIPALGGPERKLAPLVMATFFRASGLSWSADGKQLVFVDGGDQSSGPNRLQLNQLSLDSLQRRVIDTGCAQSVAPAFSPGGDLLAYVCEETWGISAINLRHTSNGSTSLLYRAQGDIDGLAWSRDSKRLAFSTNDPEGPGLYHIAIASPGHREKVWVGHAATKVRASSSGNKLAFVQRSFNANIWEVDLRGHQPRARRLIASTRLQSMPAISPDGNKIAFYSNRSGSDEIWICDGDGSNTVQVTSFGGAQTGTPRWSPDGKRLAFDSRAGGEANVYTVDLGGIPRKLQTGTHNNIEPSWSHDGRWLYFTADATTWKVSAQGGDALRITHPNALLPQESTDGLYVYFLRRIDDKFYVWRVRPGGSDEQPVAGLPPVDYEGWYPTQSGIYFIENSGMEIQYFDLVTSHIRRIYTLQKHSLPVIGGLAISPDGTWLLYSQIDEISSDLMMVENWR